MPTANLAILIVLFPLIGWAVLGLFGKRLDRRTIGSIATSAVAGSFIVGLLIALRTSADDMPLRIIYGRWIAAGGFEVPFGIQIDQLSLIMTLVVSGVAALIHFYSTGYMADDPGYSRYFSYLNLFTGMMLVLVLADNFLLMFVGWEGVGLCSYLLIGFWFNRRAAFLAAKKAFLVNRIGDSAFLIGLFLLATSPLAITPQGFTRTLTYETVFSNLMSYAQSDQSQLLVLLPLITAIAILLFIGATGKSAQIPLYVWLPDAMEGPTPVSALIHAATMVTAGVYLVARAHLLYLFSPTAMALIVIIGSLTAFFAATIALAQTDIKRTLAYSTISQIGYMFAGAGAGAFFAAIFHLMTHAFFKACLFLGAGSIIHGTGQQDLRHLGGLKSRMPITRIQFLLGTAALAGFPFLSAFFSKDTILHEAFVLPFAFGWNVFAGALGFVTAILTAFYAYRLYYRTFEGDYKGDPESHPHDPPLAMRSSVWILAALSVIAGLAGLPIKGFNLIQNYLNPVFLTDIEESLKYWGMNEHPLPVWIFMLISLFVFLGGWWAARSIYIDRPELADSLKIRFMKIHEILWEKYRIDEFYQSLFIKPGYWFFGLLWRAFDEEFIDKGLVEGTGRATLRLSDIARPFQNGYLRTYAVYMLIGIVVLVWLSTR